MAIPIPLTKAQIDGWIHTQDTWTYQLGKHWKGQRSLGQGAFGITALWEYKGPENEKPEITQVVVKQVSYDMAHNEPPWGGMDGMSEGKILSKFSIGKTKHIIKIYGGNKVGDRYWEMNAVVKIFLEYCPGGDLEQLLAVHDGPGPRPEGKGPYHEADLWTIFYCLSLGVVAMSRGTEDFRGPGGWDQMIPPNEQTEVCHFDIKPDNLLFGFRDPEHVRLPILKIADFGEAREVKLPHWQDDDYGGTFSKRGNREMSAPEETVNQGPMNPFPKYPLLKPRKGDCSNIFQVGCVMNCLLLGQKLHFNREGTVLHKSELNDTLKRGHWHHAKDLEIEPISERYSKELRALVTECLIRESLKRPNAIDLVTRCERGLADAQKVMNDTGIVPSNMPGPLINMPMIPLEPAKPPDLWVNDKENIEYDIGGGTFANFQQMPSVQMGTPGVFGNITSRLQQLTPPITPPQLWGWLRSPGSGSTSTPAQPSRLNPATETVNPPRMTLNPEPPEPPGPPEFPEP